MRFSLISMLLITGVTAMASCPDVVGKYNCPADAKDFFGRKFTLSFDSAKDAYGLEIDGQKLGSFPLNVWSSSADGSMKTMASCEDNSVVLHNWDSMDQDGTHGSFNLINSFAVVPSGVEVTVSSDLVDEAVSFVCTP
jgi:hypothetical protein